MKNSKLYSIYISLIVALGGFLMGFDASVISGVIKFVSIEFDLSPGQKGFAVASLTLTSTIAMMFAGPLSDKFGRKKVLLAAASLFFVSAIYSALSPDFANLIIARMIGGIGVGTALIVPPMYIAEIAPPKVRGRLVSFNQLNIVIGLSVAFFTNYLILQWGDSGSASALKFNIAENNWRWMLSLEAIPAVLYFSALFFVPESPRWLALRGKKEQAVNVLSRFEDRSQAEKDLKSLLKEDVSEKNSSRAPLKLLFKPAFRYVLTIGIVIAVLQQITGINAVFFYAPMIFEQTGIGTDASFANAVIIGLTNLVFTIVAILFVDRLGRKPLLIFGLIGITISMFILSGSFKASTYTINDEVIATLKKNSNYEDIKSIEILNGKTFNKDIEFKKELAKHLDSVSIKKFESDILVSAIDINPWVVLFGIIAFVASFAVSLGPVMWILFSELFPDRIRGLAISFVGLINSAISFTVQQLFPVELAKLGNSATYFIFGVFAVLGLIFVILKIPETKGKSFEELEQTLIGK